MVNGMATKKYTVTLPEELAEAIRTKVGAGEFSRYVTQAVERQAERDRLGELVDWWEKEYGEITEVEKAEADAEFREIMREHAELAEARRTDAGQEADSGQRRSAA